MSDNLKEAARALLNLKITTVGNGENGQLSQSTEALQKLKAVVFWMVDKAVTIVDVNNAKINDRPQGWIGRIRYSNGQYYEGKILEISRDTSFLEEIADKFRSALKDVETELEVHQGDDNQSQQNEILLSKRVGRKKRMSDYICDDIAGEYSKENDCIDPKSAKKSVNQNSKIVKRTQKADIQVLNDISNMTPLYAVKDVIDGDGDAQIEDYIFPPEIQPISPIATDVITPGDENESDKIILEIGTSSKMENLQSELLECKERLATYQTLFSATPQEVNFLKKVCQVFETNGENEVPVQMETTEMDKPTAAMTRSPAHQNQYKVELVEGSGVFITKRQKSVALIKGNGNPKKLVRAILEMLYDCQQLSKLTTLGGNNSNRMQPGVLEAITGFVNQHSASKLQRSEVVRLINMKCATVRRGMRLLSRRQ